MTVSEEHPTTDDRMVDLLYPEGVDAARLTTLRREVEADPELARKLRQYEVVRSLVAELPVPEPERSVHYEILRQARAAVAVAPARRGLLSWLSTLQLGPALAGALGLLLAVGGTMMLTRESAEFAPPPAATSTATQSATQVPVSKSEAPGREAASLDARGAPAPASAAASAPGVELAAARAPEGKPRAVDAPTDPWEAAPFGDAGTGRKAGVRKGNARSEDDLGGLDAFPRGPAGSGSADKTKDSRPSAPPSGFPVEESLEAGRGAHAQGAPAPAEVRSAPAKRDSQANNDAEAIREAKESPSERRFAAPPPPMEAPKARAPERRPANARAAATDEASDARAAGDANEADDGIVHGVTPKQALRGGAKALSEMDKPMAGAAPAVYAPAAPPPPAPEPVATAAATPPRNDVPESSSTAKKSKVAESSTGPASGPLDLARMARKVRQWREAARHYEDFIDRFPNNAELPTVLFETAEIYERLGENTRAIELYRLVVRSGGGVGDRAAERIANLEGQRRKQAAPAKPMPQAAPAADFETGVPNTAERK